MMTAAVLLAHAPAGMADAATVAAPMSLTTLEPSAALSAEPVGAADAVGAGDETPAANDASPGDDPKPIVVTALPGARQDPLSAVNIQSYKAVQAVDSAVVLPVAKGYKSVLPRGVRTGLRNILLNLTEPIVFVNYMLQLQPKRAVEVVGRFAINSTVGIGGVLDVARKKPFHLPHHTNGFAYTLGYYGVPSGPYLFLPLIGPTTLRDMFGRIVDQSMVPAVVGYPFTGLTYSIPTGAINALDFRVEADAALEKLHKADNPYAATRADYLARRKRDIAALHGPNHAIPIQDDTVPGATIEVPGGSAAKPVQPVAMPSASAPLAPVASPEPESGVAAQAPKPVPAPLVLTPAAPPSPKPRP
jgi:phospholipid-binding lipoprotein MlaA